MTVQVVESTEQSSLFARVKGRERGEERESAHERKGRVLESSRRVACIYQYTYTSMPPADDRSRATRYSMLD